VPLAPQILLALSTRLGDVTPIRHLRGTNPNPPLR
jgi:hypothetical protein